MIPLSLYDDDNTDDKSRENPHRHMDSVHRNAAQTVTLLTTEPRSCEPETLPTAPPSYPITLTLPKHIREEELVKS